MRLQYFERGKTFQIPTDFKWHVSANRKFLLAVTMNYHVRKVQYQNRWKKSVHFRSLVGILQWNHPKLLTCKLLQHNFYHLNDNGKSTGRSGENEISLPERKMQRNFDRCQFCVKVSPLRRPNFLWSDSWSVELIYNFRDLELWYFT